MSKAKKIQTAASGGSKTLLSARLGRPGGAHGRRTPPRGPIKRQAIDGQRS